MQYVALKPCILQGIEFRIGDTIPEGAVLPGAEAALLRRSVIARIPAPEPQCVGPKPYNIVLNSGEDKQQPVSLTEIALQRTTDLLLSKAEQAISALDGEDDRNVLLCLACLGRYKTVQEAARKRLEALEKPGDDA